MVRAGNAIDFIIDGENGFVVNPYNLSDIVSKAIQMLNWNNREDVKLLSKELVKKANYPDSAKAFIDACKCSLTKSESLENDSNI